MSEEEQIILPDGYTRVEYIESSGTQWIQTNYCPCSETKIVSKCYFITPGANGRFCGNGATYSGSTDAFTLFLSAYGSGAIIFDFGDVRKDKNSINLSVGTHIISADKNGIIIDGVLVLETNNTNTFQSINPMSIFATGGEMSKDCDYWRIYDFIIYENDEVVCHFVPCLDDNGAACMYDSISKITHYNQGTGSFDYRLPLGNENTPVTLPNGYTQLDYLYSEGKQYIDTGYVPDNESGLYIDCQSYDTKASSPFGCRNDSSTNSRFYAHRASTQVAYGWNRYNTLTTTTSSLKTKRYKSYLNYRNNKIGYIKFEDESVFENELSNLSFTPTSPIYIFDYSINGNVASASTTTESGHCGKIFRAKISQGDIVVRDYVPALDPDGVPCMFEVFTGEAYYNQGSGKFLTPLDFQRTKVPKNFKRVPWLESSGTQYINTGYIPNNETGLWIRCRKNNPATATGLQIPFGASGGGSYIYPPSINNTYLQYSWNGYTTTNGSYYYVDDGEACESSLNFYNSRIISFTSSQNNFYKTNTANIGAINKPLYVFSYDDNGTARYSLIGKVYRAKISQLDTVVRDYLPCIDEAGIPCMYDLVTQTAYYNVGTNRFSFLGGTIASYTDYCTLGIISDRLGVGDMDESVIGTLPSEFERMNYIAFDKTQYINTEMVCDDIGEMQIKIETGDEISTSSTTTWGGTTKGTSSSGSSYIYFNYSGDWGWMVSSYPELMSIISNKNWQSLKPNTLYDVKYTESSDMKTRDITVNGETKTLTIVSGYASTRSTINYYLGCRNKDGAKDVGGIYPFKLYSWSYKTRGGTLKAKMIPAKRKSDSQIGMYCLSRRTFYPLKPIQ